MPTDFNTTPENRMAVVGGLEWDDQSQDYWTRRCICLPEPNVPGNIFTEWPTYLVEQAPQGHSTLLCRLIKKNRPTEPAFSVKIYVKDDNDEVVYERMYYFVLKVMGGPLYINVKQKADPLAFDKHPSGNTESVPLLWEYPWYGTDFGYNPFHYRNHPDYKESNDQQTLNRFFAKPLWVQPEGTKIFYNVDAPGVFLNQNPEIFHDEYGIKSPYATWGLPRYREVLISNHEINTGENPNDTFTIVASYTYIDGMSDEDILIMWPTIYQYATDSSSAYYSVHHEGPETNQGEYANFKVHRPINTYVWPENDYDEYFNRWYPPTDDYSGGAIFHRLVDQVNKGMPGVWVQERFRYPEQIPPDASVNTHHNIWVTKRRRSTFTQINYGWLSFHLIFNFSKKATTEDGVFGPDYLWLAHHSAGWANFPDDFILEGHEYWAGTRKTLYTTPYYGLFVGQYRIEIPCNPIPRDPDLYPRHVKTIEGNGQKGG